MAPRRPHTRARPSLPVACIAVINTDTDLSDSTERARLRYQPFYCEENAWWLCADPALGPEPRWVLFVLNRQGACPLAAQRAVPPGALCWWDYHVVVMDAQTRIWDLDTRLGLPVTAAAWLAGSLPGAERWPAPLAPLFRVVSAADYRLGFASDRSHMRRPGGGWLHPPPPWPPIGTGMTLPAYRSTDGDGPGELLDLTQLRARIQP